MENEMLFDDDTTIKVEDTKLKTEQNISESFGIAWNKQTIKDNNYEDSDEQVSVILSSIPSMKNGCIKDWMKYSKINEDDLESKAEIKLEQDSVDYELPKPNTAEEFIIHNNNYCGTFNDPHTEIVLNSDLKQKTTAKGHEICENPKRKSFSCYNCGYIAYRKTVIIDHIKGHRIKNKSNLHRLKFKHRTCICCNKTFKSQQGHDEHIIKEHPLFTTASTTAAASKIYKCLQCSYKTTNKCQFDFHILVHPMIDSNTTYGCSYCTYNTTSKSNLAKHIHNKHKFCTCPHCDAMFKYKQSLDDHLIKKHPEHISSYHGKIHECQLCPYKTVVKRSLARHMRKHPDLADTNYVKCSHCNQIFRHKSSLADHIANIVKNVFNIT
ncbi:unnamed protein product [Callosobruchus maculatus]|uniref:C2H2-type domain-containing protein n=1 Tax=Callosobruchus maculatus TaxID=64391 RepID=A0A653DWV7_CALMS|nr:unnamed protein product [Callosobruchus maculatus]